MFQAHSRLLASCATVKSCPPPAIATAKNFNLPEFCFEFPEELLIISVATLFVLNFAISMGENDKRSLNFSKALSTSFYFQKKSLNYKLSKQTGTS